jgi:uncharacterized protein (TIGR02646 family)
MVKTRRRPPPPASLVKNREKWEARLQRVLAGSCTGDWATRACKSDLDAELRKLTHGKCVYCESMLGVTTHREIEHHVAKTVNPLKAFEWTNLLPACRLCNLKKLDQDHGGDLLKPDDEDPEPYFWLHPDTGKLEPHPGLSASEQRRAQRTIDLCDLQRGPLNAQRQEMKENADLLLQLLAEGKRSLQTMQKAWKALSDPKRQYKFVLRHVLTTKGQPALAAEDRHVFEQ